MKLRSKTISRNIYQTMLIAGFVAFSVGCGSSNNTDVDPIDDIDNTDETDTTPVALVSDSDEFSINASWSDNKWISQREDRYPKSSYTQGIQRIIYCLDNTYAQTQAITDFADGSFGPITRAAIEDFQEKRGIAVDGTVGDETWAALQDVVDAGTEASNGFNAHSVSGNSCGDEVQFYQEGEDGGWMMARNPRSLLMVPFSIGAPVTE